MGNAATNWDVSNYNQALQQAILWATKMEQISQTKDGNGWRISDADGMKRFYHCGEAVINVNVYGSPVYSKDCGGSASYSKNGDYTSGSASSATLTSGDKNILGSGWEYTPGKKATTQGSHRTDKYGNVVSHSSWTGWKGSVDGQSGTRNYVITVTFKKGTTTAENYDGSGEIGASTQDVGSSLPAHALCGPCCMHDLPAVEDKWTQIVYFDTMAISDLQVWKIESGYVQGTSEITEGNRYYEEHKTELSTINDTYDTISEGNTPDFDEDDEEPEDWELMGDSADIEVTGDDEMVIRDRLYSEITQLDPNVFYNIAAQNVDEGYGEYNTSRVGRLRYSLQTGQDDDVYYEEKNAKGELHRSNKCDGQEATLSSKNPAPSCGIPPEDPESSDENFWLYGKGNASLPFAFYKLNIDSGNASEHIKLEANVKISQASKMPVISTAHTQLFVDEDGYLSVKTDDGAEYRSVQRYYTAGETHRLGLTICFGTISDFAVTVDDSAVTFYEKKAPDVGRNCPTQEWEV